MPCESFQPGLSSGMQVNRGENTGRYGRAQVTLATGLLASAMLALPQLEAQTLRGVVLDAATKAPIAGTIIQTQTERGQTRRATSDSAGLFSLSLTGGGLYTVSATRLGYLPHRGDTIRIGDSETVGLRIELDRTAMPLQPVVITERVSWLPDGFEARRAAGFGRFLTRKDIEARRGSQTSDLLRGMPGIVLTPNRRGRGPGHILQMRGPRGLCQPAVWIDGMFSPDFADATTDAMLMPTSLEAIEVYNSTANAPIQYRTGNCGVVLFWTKRGSTEERSRIKWWKLALGAAAGLGLVYLLR